MGGRASAWTDMLPSTVNLSLRPPTDEDAPFLFALYASTREEELAAWGWAPAQRDAFLRMQWRAQQQAYAARFPGAEHHLVLKDEQRAGRLLVARGAEAWWLVDVALLPEHRGAGVGTRLLRGVLEDAAKAGQPVRLSVLRGNPARRLYARLGFREVPGADAADPYEVMEWVPAP
jgi:GNAT superfamily N-acetyltransferase